MAAQTAQFTTEALDQRHWRQIQPLDGRALQKIVLDKTGPAASQGAVGDLVVAIEAIALLLLQVDVV